MTQKNTYVKIETGIIIVRNREFSQCATDRVKFKLKREKIKVAALVFISFNPCPVIIITVVIIMFYILNCNRSDVRRSYL